MGMRIRYSGAVRLALLFVALDRLAACAEAVDTPVRRDLHGFDKPLVSQPLDNGWWPTLRGSVTDPQGR
jgi:hypothetical protein